MRICTGLYTVIAFCHCQYSLSEKIRFGKISNLQNYKFQRHSPGGDTLSAILYSSVWPRGTATHLVIYVCVETAVCWTRRLYNDSTIQAKTDLSTFDIVLPLAFIARTIRIMKDAKAMPHALIQFAIICIT